MTRRSGPATDVFTAFLTSIVWANAQTPPPSSNPDQKRATVTHATGTFDVKMTPQAPDDTAGGAALGRMLLDKRFHGELEGTSKGQMLAAGTAVKDSAGYVALEVVNGTLRGRAGTFVLQHSGTMNRGVPQLTITVVPDSGTSGLTGLAGSMTITIDASGHSYAFEYTLPDAK